MVLLDHLVALFLIFKGNSMLFSIVAIPIYIRPAMQEGSIFSTPSSVLFVDFDSSNVEHLFMCLVGHFYVFLGEMPIYVFCPLFFFSSFLRLCLRRMEVSRLEVESEPQLPAYTIVTATWDPSCICDLCSSLWQCQILNPLSEIRDWTSSWILVKFLTCWATVGTLAHFLDSVICVFTIEL